MLKKVPHTYVIIFALIIISAIAPWFIPGGEFDREIVTVNGVEREVIRIKHFTLSQKMFKPGKYSLPYLTDFYEPQT